MINEFFEAAKSALALAPDLTYATAVAMGDTPAVQDELAQLVLSGKKTATSSGFELYLKDHAPLPRARDVNIILDSQGQPVALTYTEDVFIEPFATIDDEQARLEGEGDLSLAYWQKVHREFFTKAYAEAGLQFDPEAAMVVVERFRVLYPLPEA